MASEKPPVVPGQVREVHTYPIYYCEIFWPATDGDGKRVIDCGGGEYMFRTPPSQAEIDTWTAGLWDVYRAKAKAPGRPVFQVRFVRWDTWCLGWFSHWTWDTGQSDGEVLASFGRYVLATEVHNERQRAHGRDEDRCLMGAEDRWRWSGEPTGAVFGGMLGTTSDNPPPCRCAGCKKNGVIRICH